MSGDERLEVERVGGPEAADLDGRDGPGGSAEPAEPLSPRDTATKRSLPATAAETGELQAAREIDARALRVSLSPGSAVAGTGPILVEPAPDPGTVLLDGEPIVATLDRLGDVRRRLSRIDRDGSLRVDVLVMPPLAPGPGSVAPPPGVARREVVVGGWRVEVDAESEPRARLRDRARRARGEAGHGGPVEIRAIIPGRIVSIAVATGDAVEAGHKVLVLEAMKMQNEVRAPRDGTVGRVAVAPGETVEVGDILLVIE